jgi:anti-sigma regulatory factor (Ser/Thr protein kinase)
MAGGAGLREISLHILDMIENSIEAGASRVVVSVSENTRRDVLELRVEDDGPGLSVPWKLAVDPFYTTKKGKSTGLGLSLLKASAERAGGRLTLARSPLGGLAVKVVMKLRHVDRAPLGDLPGTAAAMVCTHPDLELCFRIKRNKKISAVSSRGARNGSDDPGSQEVDAIAESRRIRKELEEELTAFEVIE